MAGEPNVTRLAPSPTGALHLGNARTFLINWALARREGWKVLLRIEDLDTPRTRPGADRQAIEDLRWLGIDWDDGPRYQKSDLAPCRQALELLSRKRLVYPCVCTRADLERAASAPHGDQRELRYPGTCRSRRGDFSPPAPGSALRVIVPDEPLAFTDDLAGPQAFHVQRQVGDFVVATKVGLPAYQLAVVVDDARQGVTHVVRGDDLLASTARQLWLYRHLDLTPPPHFLHLPLVVGPDGRRLAKRHGDSRLDAYRRAGTPPHRVIGLLAYWSGIQNFRGSMTAGEFRDRFDLTKLPREPITFTEEDHRWLLTG